MKSVGCVFSFVCILLFIGSHGDVVSHVLLLEDVPSAFNENDAVQFIMRTNYKAQVQLVYADTFSVLVNITSPSLAEAYRVHPEFTEHRGALMLQVHENTDETLPIAVWLIIVAIGAFTAFVAICSTIYATCWYRRHVVHYNVRRSSRYHDALQQSTMYRSRNSMQLSSQPGDMPLFAEEENFATNDDTLQGVPELPEQEESEALEMKELAMMKEEPEYEYDSNDNNDEDTFIKRRYQSPAKAIDNNLAQQKKKRQNKNKEPYSGAMEYPDQSSEGSLESLDDVDSMNIQPTENSFGYGFNKTPYGFHGRDIHSFKPSIKPTINSLELNLVTKSGGDLLRDYENVPRPADDLVAPSAVKTPLKEEGHSPSSKFDSEHQTSTDKANPSKSVLVMALVHQPGVLNQVKDHSGAKLSPKDTNSLPVTNINSGYNFYSERPSNVPLTSFTRQSSQDRIVANEKNGPYIKSDVSIQRVAPNNSRVGYAPDDSLSEGFITISDSERSLHGSSEIYDNNRNTFYSQGDSDVEIPPLDSDDMTLDTEQLDAELIHLQNLAECSRPPIQISEENRNSVANSKYKDIGLTKLVTFNPPPLPKPYKPLSGFMPGQFNTRQSLDSGIIGSDHGISQMSADEFDQNSEITSVDPSSRPSKYPYPPVPPKPVSYPGYHEDRNKQYVEFRKDRSPSPGQANHGGGSRGLVGNKQLHLAIVSSLCIISLFGGVYCQTKETETSLKITIFAPRGFIMNTSAIYFNKEKGGEITEDSILNVQSFEVPNAILDDKNSSKCNDGNRNCAQGCDENTGACICRKGFRMDRRQMRCQDVNECMEGGARCHQFAGCLNTKGSYRCTCTDDYYGDGKSCSECAAPCEDGTYETQPCSTEKREHKVCKDCTLYCQNNYFMYRRCDAYQDANCILCSQQCSALEFEYTSCSGAHNRVCKERKWLSKPILSSNLIVEDQHEVQDQTTDIRYMPASSVIRDFTMIRGSGLKVKLIVKNLNPVHRFKPVDHSLSNDNQSYRGRADIKRKYCPYPVPDHYELAFKIHKDISYKLNDDITREAGKPQPCKTYKSYGSFPVTKDSSSSSILCAENGPLSDIFDLDSEFLETTTSWVDASQSCSRSSVACEDCARQCAHRMAVSNQDCVVIGNDNDDGWSPRLQVCYSCCTRNNCSSICENYHRDRCQRAKCHTGSVSQFVLKPIYPSQGSIFYCHVEPVIGQRLLDLEYIIFNNDIELHRNTLQIMGDYRWINNGWLSKRHDLLHIEVNSRLQSMPDIVRGDLSVRTFMGGLYRKQGEPIDQRLVRNRTKLLVHPAKQFGISSLSWKSRQCTDELDGLLKATPETGPYSPMNSLMVQFVRDNTYIMTNLSVASSVSLTIPKQASVLKTIFPAAVIRFDELQGDITHNTTHWIVKIVGEIIDCPGVFSVSIADVGYSSQPLFDYDIVVQCPTTFNLTFEILTGDPLNMGKEFDAVFTDKSVTYHLRLHRLDKRETKPGMEPVKLKKREGLQQTSSPANKNLAEEDIFSVPVVASVCGAVILLLFMAAFGLCIVKGVHNPEEVSILRCRHVLITVVYMTYKTVYTLVVSLSIFSLIIIYYNSNTSALVRQYRQQSGVQIILNRLHLGTMNQYLYTEIDRQNSVANNTKAVCEVEMTKIISDINNIKRVIITDTKGALKGENINTLIGQNTRAVLEQFGNSLQLFRQRFDLYLNFKMEKLIKDLDKISRNVEDNQWLSGAKFLHGSVSNIRTVLKNIAVQDFSHWSKLDYDISNIKKGLLIPASPSLPDVQDILRENIPKKMAPLPSTKQEEKLTTVTRLYNFWFHPNTGMEHVTQNRQSYLDSINKSTSADDSNVSSYIIFLYLMIAVDVLWFLHRFLKAVDMSRLLLIGYPLYFDCREKIDPEHPSVDDAHKKQSCRCSPCQAAGRFLLKICQTKFIPKMAATIVVALGIYSVVSFSETYITTNTFKSLGYFSEMEELYKSNEALINSRIEAHAQRINTMEYPAYQGLINSYIQRHQFMLSVYEKQIRDIITTHSAAYCDYIKSVNIDVLCRERNYGNPEVQVTGCRFPPVLPKYFHRDNTSEGARVAEKQMDILLSGVRAVISGTCFIVLIYLSIMVLSELLGSVIWLYVKRSGIIRLQIICETDEEPVIREK